MEWKEGQKVRAVKRITEGGTGNNGSPDAQFPESNYIHAEKGDLGVVEGVDDGCPTVRFWPKGTATIVSGQAGVEVELLDEQFVSKPWHEYTQEERESQVDTVLSLLRKHMSEPDSVISVRQSKPTHRGSAGELRFTGVFEMEVKVSGRIKPFCQLCGNMGHVPVLGEQEQRKWPHCTCEFGQKLTEKADG